MNCFSFWYREDKIVCGCVLSHCGQIVPRSGKKSTNFNYLSGTTTRTCWRCVVRNRANGSVKRRQGMQYSYTRACTRIRILIIIITTPCIWEHIAKLVHTGRLHSSAQSTTQLMLKLFMVRK